MLGVLMADLGAPTHSSAVALFCNGLWMCRVEAFLKGFANGAGAIPGCGEGLDDSIEPVRAWGLR